MTKRKNLGWLLRIEWFPWLIDCLILSGMYFDCNKQKLSMYLKWIGCLLERYMDISCNPRAENISGLHQRLKQGIGNQGLWLTYHYLRREEAPFLHLLICLFYSYPSLQMSFLCLGVHMAYIWQLSPQSCFAIPSHFTGMKSRASETKIQILKWKNWLRKLKSGIYS